MNRAIALNSSAFHPFIIRWRFSLRVLWISGFIFIATLLVFYIFQVNELAKVSYSISNFEQKISLLAEENKNLEINFSQTNSLGNIETLIKGLNFKPIGQVRYIRVLESTMVTK